MRKLINNFIYRLRVFKLKLKILFLETHQFLNAWSLSYVSFGKDWEIEKNFNTNHPIISVKGDATLSSLNFELSGLSGLRFGTVTGSFNVRTNKLNSFKGFPTYVGNKLMISDNNIRDFIGFPIYVGESILFSNNPIECFFDLHRDLSGCEGRSGIVIFIEDRNRSKLHEFAYSLVEYGVIQNNGRSIILKRLKFVIEEVYGLSLNDNLSIMRNFLSHASYHYKIV